jgi:hypothetical protein
MKDRERGIGSTCLSHHLLIIGSETGRGLAFSSICQEPVGSREGNREWELEGRDYG